MCPFKVTVRQGLRPQATPVSKRKFQGIYLTPPPLQGFAGATTRKCFFSSHGFQLNVASKRFHKHGLFSTCFFWGRRKGVAFPNSLMCISCFQCLHSTMCEVTRQKPNVAFVPVYYSRTHPTKNAWRKSPG